MVAAGEDQVGEVSNQASHRAPAEPDVIEHSGLRFRVPPPQGIGDDRVLYLGDDDAGNPIEVMAVELEGDELYVIHAMPMRNKYQEQYEEAKRWRV